LTPLLKKKIDYFFILINYLAKMQTSITINCDFGID